MVERYWELEARPHEDDLATTVATIRELLEDIVPRQLISDVPLCMLLSGGLDSSVLVALARKVEGTGDSLRTFAVDFGAESVVDDKLRLFVSRDSPFADEVARHLGVSHTEIELDAATLLEPEVRRKVLLAMDSPANAADADTSLYALFRAIREHSTVAVSGEAADEVFGGYPWMHDETAVSLPLFPWMTFFAQNDPGTSTLADSGIVNRFGILEYIMGQTAESLAEVPHLDDEDPGERRMREVMHQHLTRFLPNLLDRKDRMSMATGLEVRVPFCDHRLLEYVFNTPWSMKTFDGREKSLLREATRDLLPPSVLDRQKSGYPATQDPRYDDSLRAALTQLAADPDNPVLNLFGADDLASLLDDGSCAFSVMRRLRLESAVRMSAWFKEYQVEYVEA